MFNIFSPHNDVFALDLSDLSLKIVQLTCNKKGLSCFIYGQSAIPEGLIEQGEIKIKKQAELAAFIKKAVLSIGKGKIKTKYAAVSLPEEKSFVDVLRLPKLKKQQINQAVTFEAANYIPVPLDEVYFDFEVINSPYPTNDCIEVLIAATPKKIIDDYILVLGLAGFKPFLMEVESLSLARALVRQDINHHPLLIVDFGQLHSSFAIFAGSSLRFTSTIPISSRELNNLLMKELNIDIKKAEEIKQTEGLWGERKILDAIIPALTDLTEQIQKHLDYYHSHTPANQRNHSVEKILLCGGGANLKGLAGFLANSLKLKVELGNPWVNIFSPSSKKVLPITLEQSINYATALGLAAGALAYD